MSMKQFSVTWDRDYGIDRRTGWTVVVDGIAYEQLQRSLSMALWRSFRRWRRDRAGEG